MISYDQLDFNPRSREGSDDVLSSNDFIFHDFNPRSREGSDYYSENPASDGTTFQSTLPRGERRDPKRLWMFGSSISIHAPARGATQCHLPQIAIYNNFNPRSREGSDTKYVGKYCFLDYFNPRSREGSDFLRSRGNTKPSLFQSTLPRGERHR